MIAKIWVLSAVLAVSLLADDGIWPFDRFPSEQVAKKYGFEVTEPFLHHLQLASVRFNNGGSGSFVSGQGLLFTNHHVGADCIQKVSTSEHDYMTNGFSAVTQGDEKACPDLEVNVLLKTEDVTAKVNQGIAAGTPTADANRQRKAAMAKIEKECNGASGNRCDVVTLYSGGQYSLYQYKKYTDVRLVFAPEADIAAFGGDPDNFTYPRYCLDFSLFRAYEDGKPVESHDYLKWSHDGLKDGELTFVAGNPGSTGRLQTMSQLEFQRDVSLPLTLDYLKTVIDKVLAFSAQSEENRRVARDYVLGEQNSYKAYVGFEKGLKDPKLMDRKRAEERKLVAAIDRDLEKQKQFGKVWDDVTGAYREFATFYKSYYLYELVPGYSDLFSVARKVVRYSEEKTKPNDQRLRGYQDTALPSFEQAMYSPAPISDAAEETVLGVYLRYLEKQLGANDPVVKQVLGGRSPEEAAKHYVETSKLKDVAVRKQLASSVDAIRSSGDGMIVLARLLDVPARKYRKEYADKVEAVVTTSAGKIAQARFAVYGSNEYPDATFTLRLSYGPVKGYKNAAGKPVSYTTTFAGVYKRATGKDPFKLPESWLKAKPALNLKTPFNFVTTADTHGGNSGSPTVNTKGELIGILFDGNIEGLPNRYVYTEEMARSVHVASDGIIEALRKVYHADRVLQELGFEAGTSSTK